MNPLLMIDTRPLPTPTTQQPQSSGDFQKIEQNGVKDNDQCSVISNNETAIELTDTEYIMTPGGVEMDDLRSPDRKHTWSPTSGRGADNLDDLISELDGLRKQFATESKTLKNRISDCEKEGYAGQEKVTLERDEYLNYLRKWMENIVTSICTEHPNATDVDVLLKDLRERLTRMIGTGEFDDIEEIDLHQSASPRGIMSPMSPTMNTRFSEPENRSNSCCTIS